MFVLSALAMAAAKTAAALIIKPMLEVVPVYGWKNNIPVVPGQLYRVRLPGAGDEGGGRFDNAHFISKGTVSGSSGKNALETGGIAAGGSFNGDGGGNGGRAENSTARCNPSGGTGGYSGDGGVGTNASAGGTSGAGGGGAGGGKAVRAADFDVYGFAGGGTDVYGQGANGIYQDFVNGQQGSTADGSVNRAAKYGAGGVSRVNSTNNGFGGKGGGGAAVRIVWAPGAAFPSTNVQKGNQHLPTTFYNARTNSVITESDIRRTYGVSSDLPELGIYELTEQANYTVSEYVLAEENKYKPVRDYSTEIETLTTSLAQVNAAISLLTQPEAIAIDGYYPLYENSSDAANQSDDGNYHTHTFNGIDYYMPNSGVTIYHGNYTESSY